ncbi:MAG: hypothetical protein WC304_02205 [Candidatus Gracilibacteria bacterium]|jgi:hypothetical protein
MSEIQSMKQISKKNGEDKEFFEIDINQRKIEVSISGGAAGIADLYKKNPANHEVYVDLEKAKAAIQKYINFQESRGSKPTEKKTIEISTDDISEMNQYPST